MFNQTMLLLAVLAPTLGAFILPIVGRASVRIRNALAFCLVAAALVGAICLAPSAPAGKTTTIRLEATPGLTVSQIAFIFLGLAAGNEM
jgi:hypothetical protein